MLWLKFVEAFDFWLFRGSGGGQNTWYNFLGRFDTVSIVDDNTIVTFSRDHKENSYRLDWCNLFNSVMTIR